MLHSVREVDNFSHIHRVCGHMFEPCTKWHSEDYKNATFSDVDAARVQPSWKACIYGEDRQTATDRHRIHTPLSTVLGQCFLVTLQLHAVTHLNEDTSIVTNWGESNDIWQLHKKSISR